MVFRRARLGDHLPNNNDNQCNSLLALEPSAPRLAHSRSMQAPGHTGRTKLCNLCSSGPGSIEHYSCCPAYWSFALSPRPRGLGILHRHRSRDSFFLVGDGLDQDDKIRLAVGLYALLRTVISLKDAASRNLDPACMLRLWARRGADGSSARRLLH